MNGQVVGTTVHSPTWTAAQTAYGEARGDGERGMQAVLNVIGNRAANPGWWGTDIASVCLAEDQFDCWNADDPNRPIIEAVTIGDPAFDIAFVLADALSCGRLEDITGGADSYYATSIAPPDWVKDATFTCQIGEQRFYITRKVP